MAQSDATEQVKEVLRQLIRYRFWIAVGFAALFAVIAYFMGSGPVKAKAADGDRQDQECREGVKAYADADQAHRAYKPIVDEKTEIVSKDVNKAWKELYDRQAPLLTWPETVKDRFRKWGRKWPEEQDAGTVQIAIVDYIEAYPAYVDMVYKTFHPFDYETGKGIVAAPAEGRAAAAGHVHRRGPSSRAWARSGRPRSGSGSSARCWRSSAEVNKQAKDWDTAIIQGDRPARGGQPGRPGSAFARQGRAAHQGGRYPLARAAGRGRRGRHGVRRRRRRLVAVPMGAAMMGGGRGEMMGMMGGRRRSRRGPMTRIYYVTPAEDKGQYKILPVLITVLIDQDHVQDLLVELENSPMSIQVKDFELERPSSPVTKPEKGEQPGGMGMGWAMMGGMMMMRGMMGGGRGYGGMASQMEADARDDGRNGHARRWAEWVPA